MNKGDHSVAKMHLRAQTDMEALEETVALQAEIRTLREALEEALPFVAVATSHPAITHPEGIKNAEAALSKIRTALAKGD